MGRVDEYISNKVNDCIKNNVVVNEMMIKTFRNEYNVIRQRDSRNRIKQVDKALYEYWKGLKKEEKIKAELGHKKESYFTESEMLIGYVAPSYDELSKEEKSIFNKLK